MKNDHRSKFSNLSNWKEEARKKSGLQRDSNPWPPRYRHWIEGRKALKRDNCISSFRGYSFEVAEDSAVNCKIPVTAEYPATILPRRKDNDYPPKITEVLRRWRNCSLVPREFSWQARQMTSLMTSHPKSPRTTGNEAGGIVDVVLYIVVYAVSFCMLYWSSFFSVQVLLVLVKRTLNGLNCLYRCIGEYR